jgi:hypothetical protein
MKEIRNAYRVLIGNPGGNRPERRTRRRQEDNIMVDLREIGQGWHGLESFGSG